MPEHRASCAVTKDTAKTRAQPFQRWHRSSSSIVCTIWAGLPPRLIQWHLFPRCSSCHQDRKIHAWLEASNAPSGWDKPFLSQKSLSNSGHCLSLRSQGNEAVQKGFCKMLLKLSSRENEIKAQKRREAFQTRKKNLHFEHCSSYHSWKDLRFQVIFFLRLSGMFLVTLVRETFCEKGIPPRFLQNPKKCRFGRITKFQSTSRLGGG